MIKDVVINVMIVKNGRLSEMKAEYLLEVENSNAALNLLEGDEVLVSPLEAPKGNGKDMALLEFNGVQFISTYTRYGKFILLLTGEIRTLPADSVKILGKVTGGSFEDKKLPC